LQIENLFTHQPDLGHAVLADNLEQLKAAVTEVQGIEALTASSSLDASEHLVGTAVEPIGWDKQASQRLAGSLVIIPVQVGREPATHLGHIVKTVGVKQFLGEIGVEDFQLAVPLLVLGNDLIDPLFGQKSGEAGDAAPGPKR
jgi:hypothetical protein